MGRFLVLLSLALLTIAEIGAVMWLYNWIGPAGTILVLGMDMALGIWIMRWAVRSPADQDRGWKLAGGAVIALPGLVLDLFGLALVVPATRRVLKRALARNMETAARRGGMSVITVTAPDGSQQTTVVQGDVIPGEVVDLSDAPPGPAGSQPPGQGKVIRGEILGGPPAGADPDPAS